MLVYSKKIVAFIQDVTQIVKEILTSEIGVFVSGDRFYNRKKTHSYPISIVVFNDRSMLGYFSPSFYELGFHERLLYAPQDTLRNVIRHELAHYMTFIEGNQEQTPHGPAFSAFCKKMKWGEEVSRASLCIETENVVRIESDVLRKVQKLMALSTSSNEHEAEQAMLKSQQLLLKHNLGYKYLGEEEDLFYLKRILIAPKRSEKLQAIATILQTFFVSVVYRTCLDGVALEIVGSQVNVQIAEYVAEALFSLLDQLWEGVKKKHHLKGVVARNSFFSGVAKGYCNKIKALERSYDTDVSRALVVLEKQLQIAKEMVYKRLRQVKSHRGHCSKSCSLGELAGKELCINPALSSSKGIAVGLLGDKKRL